MTLLSANSVVLNAWLGGAAVGLWDAWMAVVTATSPKKARAASVEITDLREIERTLAGDSESYKRLIERYQQHVAGILWKFTRDARMHEELVQDVFVEAYLSLRTYKGKAPLSHWLATITTRVGYGFWKQNHDRRRAEAFSLADWDGLVQADGEQCVDPSEAGRFLYALLAQLGPRDRLVLTLRYLEGCDIEETARRTGWSKSMVKVQSLRAKRRLKQLFEKTGVELEL
ncbi:MAG: RNA polymerase sigma factor [Phycisphaerae bacterium]|nr:RNA polymerase sigma factor [Phycisphaerae bacterium]